MRDIRTMNMTAGQQIESDDVMKRLGVLEYRNMGSLARIGLFDDGKAVITSGLRVIATTGMIVSVPEGTLFTKEIDVTGCVQPTAQLVTMDAASGSPRVDIVEAQISSIVDKIDHSRVGTVATGGTGGSVIITNEEIKRDIKYYLSVRKKTNTTTPTVATAGILTGLVAIPGSIDLSLKYIIHLSDGEDGNWVEIDCRGATPAATSRVEIINKINAAVGRTIASAGGGNVIILTGNGLGETSVFTIKSPITNADLDAFNLIFGISTGGIYKYEYKGTNSWFKLCEIDIGAATTTITTGMIRNIDQKSTWTGGSSDVMVRDRLFKNGTITGFDADTLDGLHANEILGTPDGWFEANETWAYFTPNFMIVSGDKTTKYSKGMKLRLQQQQALSNYWTFDASNLIASVGGVNGTAIGSPTYSAGKFSNCLTLDGTTQGVSFPNNTFIPTADFVVGMWIKSSSVADANKRAIFQSWRDGPPYYGFKIQATAWYGIIEFTIGTGLSGLDIKLTHVIYGKTAVLDTNWHYVVCTYCNNVAKIYVDGVLSGFGDAKSPVYSAPTYTRLGAFSGNGGAPTLWWRGNIDDVFLINGSSLDEQTINEKYLLLPQTAQGVSDLTLTKYFILNTPQYSVGAGWTNLPLLGGQDYNLANTPITEPHYAMVENPYRMDLTSSKWNMQTYPYATFLVAGGFTPPAWAKWVYAVLVDSGLTGAGGFVAGGGLGGGGGESVEGWFNIAEFDGDYSIRYGDGLYGPRTYFLAFPAFTQTAYRAIGAGTTFKGAAGGNGGGVGVGGGAGYVGGNGGYGGGGGFFGSTGFPGNPGFPGNRYGSGGGGGGGGGGNPGGGGNGGAGGYGSGGGGGGGGATTQGLGGAGGGGFVVLWFFKGDER